jgi:repressor LexA
MLSGCRGPRSGLMGEGLSTLQRSILRFIQECLEEQGRPPSLREIGERFGIQSTNGVRYHLSVLERKGHLHRHGRVSRGIQLTDGGHRAGGAEGRARFPILGRVSAGRPLFAEENIEDILELDSKVARSGTYGLRIRGDSMRDAGILEGDVAIVLPQESVRSGDIVVALIGEDATVKRFLRRRGKVVLKAENPKYEDIVIDSKTNYFRILGKVIGIIREKI